MHFVYSNVNIKDNNEVEEKLVNYNHKLWTNYFHGSRRVHISKYGSTDKNC